MVLISPRIQFYEICDQPWFPEYLRRMVQSCLTLAWNFRMPIMQKKSPAQLVSSILYDTLKESVTDYTYVDFCAGAGGPTPYIERDLNQKLANASPSLNDTRSDTGVTVNNETTESVKFVLTDLHPHIPDWLEASNKSKNLTFIPKPVDATNAPNDLILNDGKRVFRLFNLAFHHFDDKLGSDILKNTLETADGFGIFELQERTASSFLTISLMGLLFLIITPFYFWRSPGHLFFTYVIPIVPFVVVFDGYVSSLRTRTPSEVLSLLKESGGGDIDKWRVESGYEVHTKPIGYVTWVIGIKK